MSLRRIDSTLEGHPTPNNPWVKVATGSLGQGLPAANGMALANRLDGIDARVFCLLGDGECAEGSVWEAAQFASLKQLENLVAIVDVNGLGQSGPTPYGHDTAVLARRFEAFGWRAFEIDGHDMAAVLGALERARDGGPTVILARTVKGKGVSFLEGAGGWHGKAVEPARLQQALDEVGDVQAPPRVAPRRTGKFEAAIPDLTGSIAVRYALGAEVATREAYGHALAKLGAQNPDIVALDGDVKNSTHSAFFAEAFSDRFFECYIAEQNMVGAALGLAACGKIPFVSTFACFLSRAYDFIRMAGHSRPQHLVFCGSHAGVSIGEDGPSQMGLEDLAMFRALAHSTVLYPCDAVSAERLTEQAARSEGIVYLRTTRGKTPVIYGNDETFPVGGSKVPRASGADQCTVVAAGVTVHEALAAHDILKQQGISVRVIDAYSVKPLDVATLVKAAGETRGLVVVEDHWADGGLGDAVARAHDWLVPLRFLAVGSEPRSGTPQALLERHGISRHAIVQQVLTLVNHPDARRLRV
jgi:transketolase